MIYQIRWPTTFARLLDFDFCSGPPQLSIDIIPHSLRLCKALDLGNTLQEQIKVLCICS